MTTIQGRSVPTACICCIAAMLTKSAAATAAVATTTRVMASEQAFMGLYTPDSDVDKIAILDLDQRSIIARLAAEDEEGLTEARDIYSNGRSNVGDTASGLTIKGLSTNAKDDLKGSATYQAFVDYYGDTDYADHWVSASIDGEATTLSGKGNVDFSKFDVEGRAAAIRWGTPLLHVWMYVVGLIEKAASNCQSSGDNILGGDEMFTKENWDKALALYIGSEPRESGSGGFFLHTLTQVECYKFGTCKKGEMSPVNTKIVEKFSSGKQYLKEGNCSRVKEIAGDIKSLMTILLVQGVSRAMYALDVQDDFQETTQGMATAFAAAVLPLVDACSQGSATLIHRDSSPGKSTKGSYEVVRAAFERNYECLGINCEDIGGLADFRGTGYLLGADACNNLKPVGLYDLFSNGMPDTAYDPFPPSSDKNGMANTAAASEPVVYATAANNEVIYIALAATFGVLLFIVGFLLACLCVKNKRESTTEKEINNETLKTERLDTAVPEVEEEPKGADKEIV